MHALLMGAIGQYAAAQGCHTLLNEWCASHCPRVGRKSDGNPLVARLIGRDANNVSRRLHWACYPHAAVESIPTYPYAHALHHAANSSFCGAYSHAALDAGDVSSDEHLQLEAILRSHRCKDLRKQFGSRERQRQREAARVVMATSAAMTSQLNAGVATPLLRPINEQQRIANRVASGACGRSAYAALLTIQPRSVRGNSYMARLGDGATGAHEAQSDAAFAAAQVRMQSALILTLLASIRAVEGQCTRDFVLLLGKSVELPAHIQAAFAHLGPLVIHRVPRLSPAVPALDKAHVWRLLDYTSVALIDADALAIRSLDELFEGRADRADLVLAHHGYDTAQMACAIPLGARGNTCASLCRMAAPRREESLYTATPYTIPYHTIPYPTLPYHTIPYQTRPDHTIPCHRRTHPICIVGHATGTCTRHTHPVLHGLCRALM
jgi:hypothetical protein